MSAKYDLVIIGAGPGGYVAAIKAAKLGMRVALAEKGDIGGTCLNRGCIPTKALLHASGIYRELTACSRFGISAGELSYDLNQIYQYKDETSGQLRQGVESLLKANGVTVYKGAATIHPDHRVSIAASQPEAANCAEVQLEADHILIAAGSTPSLPPIPGIDLDGVLTSDSLLAAPPSGSSLAIIGGGVIGVEFATVFSALGWEVTIVEALPALLANMDKEISQNLKMILKKQGVTSYTDALVSQIVKTEADQLTCHFIQKEKELSVTADKILVAAGRKACSDGLLSPDLTIDMDRGRIVTDKHFLTSIPGIYAIGDVTGGIQLAHTASTQGVAAVAHMNQKTTSTDLSLVPSCVYTNPEIASVGLTEAQAKDQGIQIKTGKFIMSANGKSLIDKEERGFIKLVFREDSGSLIGAQLMCARATDMIGQLSLAIRHSMDLEQLTGAMAAHPTFYEAITEAAEDSAGEAIHIMPKKSQTGK